ncbi:MAG: CDP-glycerol glycerophosphotransferase family protein, partial [Anaerovoracaceae bacterium]
ENVLRTFDERIWKAEENLSQTLDSRIWKTEENVLRTFDGRIWKAEENLSQTLDSRIWKAEERVINKLSLIEVNREVLDKCDVALSQQNCYKNLIPFVAEEKIRIVFLFQIASFWPSWESFYFACQQDQRYDVRLVLLQEKGLEEVQTKTAEQFLVNHNIPYVKRQDFSFTRFKPHIVVIQTPFDEWHRTYKNWSINFKSQGIRLVYIPYGIEISDTPESRRDQFENRVVQNAWRIFTFSQLMKAEYFQYINDRNVVQVMGHPKFDRLYGNAKDSFTLNLGSKAMGKKIGLWKMHFVKKIWYEGKEMMITPVLEEYLAFANHMSSFPEVFWIFMPHPKLLESAKWVDNGAVVYELLEIIHSLDNALVFEEDDYRPALNSSDFVITDRSAIMIEAAVLDLPILLMNNKDFEEPFVDAIKPLTDSYVHGTTCEDMKAFVVQCICGEDPQRKKRNEAVEKCIPYFDGKTGERIKDYIAGELENTCK